MATKKGKVKPSAIRAWNISKEGRERIAAAQRKRWKAFRAARKKAKRAA